MNQLTTFKFGTNAVRVVEIIGEPWFVAVDVYRVLYGRTTGLTNRTTVLATDERRLLRKADEGEFSSLSCLFANKAHTVAAISESGLYKLIMRSDKPAARVFQDWVTREVLPAIRKTGAYGQPEVTPEAILQQHLGHVGQQTVNLIARILVAAVQAASA